MTGMGPTLWWNREGQPAGALEQIALKGDATALWVAVRLLLAAIEDRSRDGNVVHEGLGDAVRAARRTLAVVEERHMEGRCAKGRVGV